MTIKNGDMSAMPFEEVLSRQGSGATNKWANHQGLTKREMMAMHMMAHLMPNERLKSYEEQASYALMAADALLAELERTNGI